MMNRMDQQILGTLGNWGRTTGWDLWVQEDGIAEQLNLNVSVNDRDYASFKRAMTTLAGQGLILRAGGDPRRVAKGEWEITAIGQKAWELAFAEQREAPGVGVEQYIGRRISGEIPRLIYRELMGLVKAGELQIAFLRPKSED